ncbi:NADP-dependent malic enzyme (conversion of malate into pyruvate, anabolic) [Oenococcus oeni]|uniref:NAD(P)-dependent malic enzyme n=2 Tax=Oenococcus oeni TaxID=1247 RepID=UPI00107E1047|nr:NADP-dependent malic enzyme [Oenococcus oeni]AVI93666.1 malate dehydrogenase [Oenococcus oeni]SYW01081.1 NADP-dependent malic enzyme (conversion of malate into pyruvate, anabolic) [Oenococcus oeni]SYW01152.1 NADP-dependent malic enzyme (conversion of malate into pyruvate, anabolic) [Oenococcus oeni]SYW01239.1 NADP-dependent malic enzyme (conversion of malate into pyruvate, anabolic) [Oenococcus oeni]SYW14154.1 NADP-dependent malic enzyme (conversion of malate into pyruvate, anabolic) [Oenoc
MALNNTELDEILAIHSKNVGVLDVKADMDVESRQDLGKAYTPGVAALSKIIEKNPGLKDKYTISGKLVAVVTDGSAVLGLGNIGTAAGLPIVEGKSLLYKDLANVNAIPVAIDQVPVDEFVQTVKNFSNTFAGIHLEDIAAPRCFEIEEKLKQTLDIPVYHDDQEGTAIVVLAGLINAAKVVGKNLKDLRIVINGIGAAGVATARLLFSIGIKKLTLVDIHGVVKADDSDYNKYQRKLAKDINLNISGQTLDDVIDQQDVFIGLSDADVLSADQVKRMSSKPIVFALANPLPEINPEIAQTAGAQVIATGSAQYPNQVNNVLVFPGLYKGLLTYGIKQVDYKIEEVVAKALASMVENPTSDKIVPGVFEAGVVATVANALKTFAG